MTEYASPHPAALLSYKSPSAPTSMSMGEIWATVRRRRWPALAVAVAVLAVALTVAALWPATYRSIGTILIEQQQLPSDLVQSTITSFADQRIQVISQRVMTTDNLLRIAERYNLYPSMRKSSPREVLLSRMRKDIHLQMISADVIDPRQGHPTKANIAFSVSFESSSPETAARVANEIISLYLDENVKARRAQSANATAFLDDEANKLDQSIAQMETAIAAFKNKHIYTLPDQAAVNKETLIRSQDELRDIDADTRMVQQQGTYLDAQLAQLAPTSQIYSSTGERVMSPSDRLKYLRSELARVSGIYSPDHPDVMRIKQEMEGLQLEGGNVDSTGDLQRQLLDARARMGQLQEQYAPDHPDVVRLQQQIDNLKQAIKSAAAAAPAQAVDHADNPPYLQVETQRKVNAAQLEGLHDKRATIEHKIADLEDRLAVTPSVERELADLIRGLDNEQIKYREVRQKQMAAKLSESLEDEQKGERFMLIDPPRAPESPASPNRPLLTGLGIVVALAAGVLTILLLESGDGSVRNRRELEGLLEVPPLAILPLMETQEDRARQRRHRRFALAGTFGVFALALVLTHLFYRPLDLIWDAAVRKLGG